MLNKLLFTLIFLTGYMTSVSAIDYDLTNILELADKNNKDIKIARSNLQFASAVKKEAISQALPQVNAEVRYNRNFLKNQFFFSTTDSAGQERTESFTVSFDNTYEFSTSLNQTLFAFGRVGNAIQAANYFTTYSQLQYEDSYHSIITGIKKAFYLAILQQKVWEVAVASQESALDNLENIRIKFESGAVSEFDLLQAETRWQNSIPLTTQAKIDYEVAVNNLKALVDIPLREEIILIGGLETYPPLPDSVDYQIAFNQRPDYAALLWEKKLQQKRVAVERSNYYPALYGTVAYVYNASSNEFALENKNDNLIAGVTLSIPIFNGLYTSAQIQKARIDVERVSTRISQANDDIRIELQNVYLRLRESRERIDAAKKSIETARRAFEIAQTRVDNGLSTQLEFRESRVDLDRAQVNFYIAIFDYLTAYFDWQKTTGNVNHKGL